METSAARSGHAPHGLSNGALSLSLTLYPNRDGHGVAGRKWPQPADHNKRSKQTKRTPTELASQANTLPVPRASTQREKVSHHGPCTDEETQSKQRRRRQNARRLQQQRNKSPCTNKLAKSPERNAAPLPQAKQWPLSHQKHQE